MSPDTDSPTLAEEINNNTVAVQDTEPPPAVAEDPTPVEPLPRRRTSGSWWTRS